MAISEQFTFSVVRSAVGAAAEQGLLPALLARACVDVLGVDGASISLMSERVRMPLGADGSDDLRADAAESNVPASPVSPAPSQAPAESEALGRASPSGMAADAAKSSSSIARREAPMAEKKLGTGHGQRETSVIGRTTFERASSSPDEVLALRYDSRANLVAQGVIPRPESVPSRPRPFPQTPQAGFVPDPPARY